MVNVGGMVNYINFQTYLNANLPVEASDKYYICQKGRLGKFLNQRQQPNQVFKHLESWTPFYTCSLLPSTQWWHCICQYQSWNRPMITTVNCVLIEENIILGGSYIQLPILTKHKLKQGFIYNRSKPSNLKQALTC